MGSIRYVFPAPLRGARAFARGGELGAHAEPGVFASLDRPATFWHRSAVRVSRVMDPASPDARMAVTLMTNPASRKVAQIARDPRVTLFY
ncbi:MAG: hypothetical protein LC732_09280 [Acidobacteria bacterium]|nr:hypothetical protein [Acidobacteriota bacterium]